MRGCSLHLFSVEGQTRDGSTHDGVTEGTASHEEMRHERLYRINTFFGLHQLSTRSFVLWHFVTRTKQPSSNDRLIFR